MTLEGGEALRFGLIMNGPTPMALNHQDGERGMKPYAALDVSVRETSICIVDEAGRIYRRSKGGEVPGEPGAVLPDAAWKPERVGLEVDTLSYWLFCGLVAAELPVVCVEARHAPGPSENPDQRE